MVCTINLMLQMSVCRNFITYFALFTGSKSDSAGFSRASQQSMNGVVSSQSLEGVITSEPLEQVVNLEGEMEGTPAIYQITNISPSKSDPIRIGESILHSFSNSKIYSASSSPLLLRGAPDFSIVKENSF